MAKYPPPAPVSITKFDHTGAVIAAIIVQPEENILARGDWEPDSVTYTLRVMATQETGEDIFVCYTNKRGVDRRMDEHHKAHPEHTNVRFESIK